MVHCEDNDHGWKPVTGTEALFLAEQLGDQWLGTNMGEVAAARFGCKNATHAEANAIAAAAKQGISTEGATCYTTVSPCATCARLLIAAGITRVVAAEAYRDLSGWDLLIDAGIERSIGGINAPFTETR